MGSLSPVPALVLGLLAAVVVLVSAAVWVPIRFAAEGAFTEARVDGQARFRWGGPFLTAEVGPRDGVVVRWLGLRVYRGPLVAAPVAEDTSAPPKPKKRKKRWRPGLRFAIRVIRRALPTLALHAELRGRLGTGDPADTAAVHGLLSAARAWFPGVDTRRLAIDWLEPALDIEGEVSGRIWPAALIWVVASEFIQARWSRRHQGVPQ